MKQIIKSNQEKEIIEFTCNCGCVFKSDEYCFIHSNNFDGDIYPMITLTDKCPECGKDIELTT